MTKTVLFCYSGSKVLGKTKVRQILNLNRKWRSSFEDRHFLCHFIKREKYVIQE